jgi:hypothetical protein
MTRKEYNRLVDLLEDLRTIRASDKLVRTIESENAHRDAGFRAGIAIATDALEKLIKELRLPLSRKGF